MYRELQQNKSIELCASQEDMSWLRISAEIVFENHMEVKEKILEHSPLVKRIYREATNPNLVVFYLDKPNTTISRIS